MSKQVVVLLIECQRALILSQAELGAQLKVSRRTVQRWFSMHSTPLSSTLIDLVRLVFPCDAELAGRVALAAGSSLVALGLATPVSAPPAALPAPAVSDEHLVDSLVCAAATAAGLPPPELHALLLAAFVRARELGLSHSQIEAVLRRRVPADAS